MVNDGALPELWTANDAAAYLRCAPRTVVEEYRYRPGFPPPIRPGRRLLWPANEIREWALAQRAA